MPFTCVETWDAHHAPRNTVARQPSRLLGPRAALFARKGSASVLSALIHLFLLWLLVSKLAGGPGDLSGPGGSGEGLTIIDLSGAPAAAAAASRQETEAAQPPAAPASTEATKLDTTMPTELPKPEWSVTRIAMPAEPPRPARTVGLAAAAPPPSGIGNAGSGRNRGDRGNGAAGGGGAVPYDPFAGAAPLRRSREPSAASRPPSFFHRGQSEQGDGNLILDQQRLEAIVRQVTRGIRPARGTAEILVQVAPDGRILEARSTGGSAAGEAKRALRRALLGQPLYRPHGQLTKAQSLQLPVIRFG